MKKKICFLLVFLLTLTLSAEPNSWDSWTKAQFAAVPAEEQVDKLVEIFATESFYKFRGTPLLLTKCRSIIIENYKVTKPYVIQKFRDSKLVPYGSLPNDFYVLYGLIGDAFDESFLYPYDEIPFFESKEEYAVIMLPILEEKLEHYLREFHTIDYIFTTLLREINQIKGNGDKVFYREDLPELLEEYTRKGYTELSINPDLIPSYEELKSTGFVK